MFNVGQETYSIWIENFNKESATFIDEIESTQDQAKGLLNKNSLQLNNHLVVCEEQTKGKGRGHNSWSSPNKTESLQCSIIYKLSTPPQPITTPLFGWAVYKSLCEAFGAKHFSIKAPNDIYINEKKVSGLLLDSVSQGECTYLIFGIGLNVFSSPKDIAHATSLIKEGITVDLKTWTHFIFSLKTNLDVVAEESMTGSLKSDKVTDLTFALKAYFDNNIQSISPNGDLHLTDQTKISWRDL